MAALASKDALSRPVHLFWGAVVGLAIFVPGVSVWPVVALYVTLGIILPVRDDSPLDF